MFSLLRYIQPQFTVNHPQFLVYGDAQWYNTFIIVFLQRLSVQHVVALIALLWVLMRENIYKSIVIWLLNSRMKKTNMTNTRKCKSCKQTKFVSKDIDENELNDMWYDI
jgi:hypothetical protein